MITKSLVPAALLATACFGMPTANAADASIALSVGYVNENPPVTVVGGSGVNANPDAARIASLSDCQGKGGNHCVTQVIATNGCAAIGANDFGEFTGVQNADLGAARAAATAQLSNQQGARVVISGCSTRPIREVPGGLDNLPTAVQGDPAPPKPTQPWHIPTEVLVPMAPAEQG